ncbi:hypothetical protein RIF29_24149 [Crotalaria pallida]|uniref:Uncharacterized protein n=1 Tax=Crotalaria pallida TaxID=3830 RepID=A0AAN9EJ93_CROPI
MSFPIMAALDVTLDVAALDVAALDVVVEELVIPHLGAMEIAEALLGALVEEAVNAFMEGLAIEIAEVVLGALLEEAMIDIYL